MEIVMFSLLQLLASFRQGSARRSAARALRRLPPAQLADLGIAPDQIDDLIEATMRRSRWDADTAALRRSASAGRQVAVAVSSGRVSG
jgi:uncharacterized protein YjiS (DUF1127 family)